MKLYIYFLLLFAVSTCFSQTANIPFKQSSIKVDGNLNEPIWNDILEHTNFYNYYPNNGDKASNQTIIKMFHNGKSLFVSAIYYDTTPKVQINSLKRDGSIGTSDSFIMLIDPFNKQQLAYYFASNGKGVQVDGLVEAKDNGFSFNKNWNAVWKSKTSVNGNKKIYEFEIPLKAFGFDANNPIFGFQFYLRNIKINEWTIFKPLKSEFRLFDLRFFTPFKLEGLIESKIRKFTITPSVTYNHLKNVINNTNESNFKPSLDIQYNLSSSLKLDATINPDFSQIEVDEQVTNLTRFAINFPEKRSFFLENSDLFSNLGVQGVNPFYSRKIGALSDIQFGLKLSGNVSPNTRIGIIDVQTEKGNDEVKQNYGALVIQQKISDLFTSTAFLLNKQNSNDYNRVAGINLNYKSNNNKWTGLANYGKSFTANLANNNNFYNAGVWYDTKKVNLSASLKKVEKNYITDIGFVPRLYNYDAENDLLIRNEFTNTNASIILTKYPKKSKKIYSYRYLFLENNTYFDADKKMSQTTTFFNNAIFFKNSSSIYLNIYHDYVNLKYEFNPLQNGSLIKPNTFSFASSQIGYNSIFNKKAYYNVAFRYGNYYNGKRTRFYSKFGYHLLPFANIETSYEINKIDLDLLGNKTFHLARLAGEIFLSNQLNWTTYVQYNTQFDNFNINSRVQWEYKPLSYIYLVLTDNFNQEFQQKNWGLAFKMNYRFDI